MPDRECARCKVHAQMNKTHWCRACKHIICEDCMPHGVVCYDCHRQMHMCLTGKKPCYSRATYWNVPVLLPMPELLRLWV